MPFAVAEFDPREISFFHHDRAFRHYDPLQATIQSVYPGLAGSPASLLSALDWNKLTDSELTVVHLIAEGATIRSVLEQLHRSPHTVKAHIHNAFANLASRFGLNSRNSCAVRIN